MSILSFTKKIAGRGVKPASKVKKKKKTEKALVVPIVAGSLGLKPLLSEKSMMSQSKTNTVAFRVAAHATKGQVMTAVAERYNVTPLSVRTLAGPIKNRRRGRTAGKTRRWKKAYVTLPSDATIDLGI